VVETIGEWGDGSVASFHDTDRLSRRPSRRVLLKEA
jgi:hypothetical protein